MFEEIVTPFFAIIGFFAVAAFALLVVNEEVNRLVDWWQHRRRVRSVDWLELERQFRERV